MTEVHLISDGRNFMNYASYGFYRGNIDCF